MTSDNKHQSEETTIEKLDSNLSSASQKIAENKKVILWAIISIAVIAVLIVCYLFLYRAPRENRAFEAFNQVEMQAMGNDSIAAAEYKKVAEKYSGSDAGSLAALSAAEYLYDMGKYKEALEELDDFSSSEPVLKANAYILKGDCLVNLKKYDDALSAFKKATSVGEDNNQIAPRALLKMANIYDEQKNYKKALECYETIQEDYATFTLGNGLSIESYIEREKARLGE